MTDALATILGEMVPLPEGAGGDWERVCCDAERRARRPTRRRRLALGAALAFVALLLAPLAVVGSSRDWWFFAQGHGPKPATPVAVVASGSWGGQAWTLTAFRNKRGNICYSVDAGQASALTCADTKGHDFLGFVEVMPAHKSLRWFAAVTKRRVDRVAVSFSNGKVVRAATIAGPPSLDFAGRFVVVRQPDDPAITISHVGGYAADGRLIACLDHAAHRVSAPLAVCAG